MPPIDLSISIADVVIRLTAAMLIGMVLGVNRDLNDKPAGLRTHSLVTIGSALLTLVSISFASMQDNVDSGAIGRVAQGIVTGIGFLGAGVILQGESPKNVRGLTTAASIWLSASLGIACGAGQWPAALITLVLTLFVLSAGGPIERAIYRRWRQKRMPLPLDELEP
jgi:putative Mg2+ transporter-C (MgtC) family protein